MLLPVLTHRLPRLSTAGAAPPIQIAPLDVPLAAATVKNAGAPASGTATSRPRYVGQSPKLPPKRTRPARR